MLRAPIRRRRTERQAVAAALSVAITWVKQATRLSCPATRRTERERRRKSSSALLS